MKMSDKNSYANPVVITFKGQKLYIIEVDKLKKILKLQPNNCDSYTRILSEEEWDELMEEYPELKL